MKRVVMRQSDCVDRRCGSRVYSCLREVRGRRAYLGVSEIDGSVSVWRMSSADVCHHGVDAPFHIHLDQQALW